MVPKYKGSVVRASSSGHKPWKDRSILELWGNAAGQMGSSSVYLVSSTVSGIHCLGMYPLCIRVATAQIILQPKKARKGF
jgi:hypothetical protein